MKTYAIFCKFVGETLSYHARDYEEAIRKAKRFFASHNFEFTPQYHVIEITRNSIHNLKNELFS